MTTSIHYNNAADVRGILEHPHRYRWTLHGSGVLSMNLTDDGSVQLHVWSHADRAKGMPSIHGHRWAFQVEVVSGAIVNIRYRLREHWQPGDTHDWSRVWMSSVEGEDGEPLRPAGEPTRTSIYASAVELHEAGWAYLTGASELHETRSVDGAVTVVTRRFEGHEAARACWPVADGPDGWMNAEPREATVFEVERITGLALSRWCTRPMRPSDIRLDDVPLQGVFGKAEGEAAAAVLIHGLASAGDTWRIVTHNEIGDLMLSAKSGSADRLSVWFEHRNPSALPLFDAGFAERTEDGVAFATKGLAALRLSKWCEQNDGRKQAP